MLKVNLKKTPINYIDSNYYLKTYLNKPEQTNYLLKFEEIKLENGEYKHTFNDFNLYWYDYWLINFSIINFGLKSQFINLLLFKYEKMQNFNFIFLINNRDKYVTFLTLLYNILPCYISLKKKKEFQILFLDFIKTYRSYRHFYGLPSRGQRTWSNNNTAKNNINILKNNKIIFMKKYFANVKCNDIPIVTVAEYYNLLWYKHWKHEWRCVSRLWESSKLEKGHKKPKLDFYSTAKKLIFTFWKKKYQKIKQRRKQILRKNVYTLGFKPFFIKSLFKTKLKLNLLYNRSKNN